MFFLLCLNVFSVASSKQTFISNCLNGAVDAFDQDWRVLHERSSKTKPIKVNDVTPCNRFIDMTVNRMAHLSILTQVEAHFFIVFSSFFSLSFSLQFVRFSVTSLSSSSSSMSSLFFFFLYIFLPIYLFAMPWLLTQWTLSLLYFWIDDNNGALAHFICFRMTLFRSVRHIAFISSLIFFYFVQNAYFSAFSLFIGVNSLK